MEEVAFKSLCHSVGQVQQEKMGSLKELMSGRQVWTCSRARETPENFCNNSNQQKREEMVGITHPNLLQRDKFSAPSKFSNCAEGENAERSNRFSETISCFI